MNTGVVSPLPGLGRMMVFVDGENLVYRYEAMVRGGRTAVEEVQYLAEVFVWRQECVEPGLNTVLRATYYTYAVGDDETLSNIRRTIKGLGFQQYRPVGQFMAGSLPSKLTPWVFKKSKNQKGKGVDIQMTVDILSNVYKENLDVVYLVTGDGDYLPVVEEVMRCGKQVYLAALSSGLSETLVLKADRFVSLDNVFFKPA